MRPVVVVYRRSLQFSPPRISTHVNRSTTLGWPDHRAFARSCCGYRCSSARSNHRKPRQRHFGDPHRRNWTQHRTHCIEQHDRWLCGAAQAHSRWVVDLVVIFYFSFDVVLCVKMKTVDSLICGFYHNCGYHRHHHLLLLRRGQIHRLVDHRSHMCFVGMEASASSSSHCCSLYGNSNNRRTLRGEWESVLHKQQSPATCTLKKYIENSNYNWIFRITLKVFKRFYFLSVIRMSLLFEWFFPLRFEDWVIHLYMMILETFMGH